MARQSKDEDAEGAPEPLTREPEPLRREKAGSWRTKDGRFLVRGESGGHWYVVDEATTDPFGLGLTTGPFATIDAARQAIAEARAGGAPGPMRPVPAPKRKDTPATARSGPVSTAPPRPARETKREGPKEPSWLERLPPAERGRARRAIDELTRLGIGDAADVVRLDVTADRPAIAAALLQARLAALADRSADPKLARDVLGSAMHLLSSVGRDVDASDDLPGWRLVEIDSGRVGRRILIDAGDLAPAEPREAGRRSRR